MNNNLKFVFFGSSRFSEYVLEELKREDYFPIFDIQNAKEDLPIDDLKALHADVFIVASFGKIIPKSVLEIPKYGCLNVHPSMLPKYRGPSPIQNQILDGAKPGVTIIRMDEKMDHGPILAQKLVDITPWPDHYDVVEEKLGKAGGELLANLLSSLPPLNFPENGEGAREGEDTPQDDSRATFVKMIKKEDGLLNLNANPEENYRKVLAYSTWPGAYFFHKRQDGKEIRVVIKDAEIKNGIFTPLRVVPAGKKEMSWEAFLKGNA